MRFIIFGNDLKITVFYFVKTDKLYVADRLSTIQKCNRILVLENGIIAEEGTYSDLIKKDGIFKGLVAGQEV